MGWSPWGHKESDSTETHAFHSNVSTQLGNAGCPFFWPHGPGTGWLGPLGRGRSLVWAPRLGAGEGQQATVTP